MYVCIYVSVVSSACVVSYVNTIWIDGGWGWGEILEESAARRCDGIG